MIHYLSNDCLELEKTTRIEIDQDIKLSFFSLDSEKLQFLEAFPCPDSELRKKARTTSRPDVHPDTVKTAVYIKHLFMVCKWSRSWSI